MHQRYIGDPCRLHILTIHDLGGSGLRPVLADMIPILPHIVETPPRGVLLADAKVQTLSRTSGV